MNISIILSAKRCEGGLVNMVVTSEVIEETPYDEIIEPTCPSCRQRIPWDVDVCPHCGYQITGKVKPKEAPKVVAPARRRRKGKRGNIVAAGSIVVLGLTTILTWEYIPGAMLIPILMIVALIVLSAAPAE